MARPKIVAFDYFYHSSHNDAVNENEFMSYRKKVTTNDFVARDVKVQTDNEHLHLMSTCSEQFVSGQSIRGRMGINDQPDSEKERSKRKQ